MSKVDEVIHQSTRLKLMAVLRGAPEQEGLDFTRLKKIMRISDGGLGNHLATLDKAGYVQLTKSFVGNKPRTVVTLTSSGLAAFEGHVQYLKALLETDARIGDD